MTALQFLKTVVKVRAYLLRTGKSLKNEAEMHHKLKPIKAWVEAYKNAPEHGALNMIRKYRSEIADLLPGMDSKCGPQLHQEFQRLTSN